MGYDIVVWLDKDGDVVTRAFTDNGHTALRGMANDYTEGDILQIYIHPDDFYKEMPAALNIGLLTPKGIQTMHSPSLH